MIDQITIGPNRDKVFHYPLNSILKSLPIATIEKLLDSFYASGTYQEPPYMNINQDQLLELSRSELVTIGAHTASHPILSNESDNGAESQIKDSIDVLGEVTQDTIDYFAYPNGIKGLDFGQREMRILDKSGIKLAFSTEKRKVSVTDNKLCIPRIGISVGNLDYISRKIKYCRYWDFLRSLRGTDMETHIRKRLKDTEWKIA